MPFAPTPPEVALVNQIFLRGDTQKLNALTGDKAISVFKAAKLPDATLGDIWAIGDPENNGFLTRAGCAKVVRLLGWAQHGETNIGDHLLEKGRRDPLSCDLKSLLTPNVQSDHSQCSKDMVHPLLSLHQYQGYPPRYPRLLLCHPSHLKTARSSSVYSTSQALFQATSVVSTLSIIIFVIYRRF